MARVEFGAGKEPAGSSPAACPRAMEVAHHGEPSPGAMCQQERGRKLVEGKRAGKGLKQEGMGPKQQK